MNFVSYKDQERINLEQVITFFKINSVTRYQIVFMGDHLRVEWSFSSVVERDCVFLALMEQADVEELTLE